MVYQRFGKRLFDLGLVLLTAPLWLPLIGLIAFVVRIGLGSPVILRQSRPGLNARPFTLLKFRTMTFERNAAGNLLPDNDRLTAIGRFLRFSSLDELPELINVLRGEMSLVGPRPLLAEDLGECTPEHERRFDLRSGMSGWAQVNGRNTVPWSQRFEMDLWYVDNISLWTDMKILALTVPEVLSANGVSTQDRVTDQGFREPSDAVGFVRSIDSKQPIARSPR